VRPPVRDSLRAASDRGIELERGIEEMMLNAW
jgi:hypothetical protein